MDRLALFALATLLTFLNVDNALAVDASAGTFAVSQRCEAFQSFKNKTNPGGLAVEPGQTYPIAEVNRERFQWVRVKVGSGKNNLRWVSADCGQVDGLVMSEAGAQACRIPDQYDSYVLAVTWQPGFCEHDRGGPAKPECQAMKKGALTVNHFTLHGLWPNKQSCGIDYGQCEGAELDLSADTVEYIKPWMPNFHYGTQFGNYEWKKHGVCQTAMSDDAYFRFAVDLLKSFNDSQVGQYIRGNVGGEVSREQVYSKLADEFGSKEARNNFLLICSGDYLEEIRVSLPKDFKGERTLKGVIGQAFLPRQATDRSECRADRIRIEASGAGA